jgi:DNA replication protein DnaC
MKTQNIKAVVESLKLYGILEFLEHRLEQASMQCLTPAEILTLFLEDEALYRKNLAIANLEKKATFRRKCVLETMEISAERGLSKTKLRELSMLGFWNSKKNLIFVGPTGVGKTEVSIAVGRAACAQKLSVKFWGMEEFLEEVHRHRTIGKITNLIKKLNSVDIIVLDDFGLRPYSHDEAVFLARFLEERYKNKIHIISSQVNTTAWKSLFEDKVIADAIVDRLLNPSEKIVLSGTSLRESPSSSQINAPTSLT